jgi:hypothetical protein
LIWLKKKKKKKLLEKMSDHPKKNTKSGTADVDPGTRDVKSKAESKKSNQCQFCKRILSSKQLLEEHIIIHEHFGHSWTSKKP